MIVTAGRRGARRVLTSIRAGPDFFAARAVSL